MSTITAHCHSYSPIMNESNDEFTLNFNPSDYQSLTNHLQQYYENCHSKQGFEITYYNPKYDCNIRIIDDDSLNECLQSSIQDICVRVIANTSIKSQIDEISQMKTSDISFDMSFLSGSDSILKSISNNTIPNNELDELSKIYNSIEIVDKEGNGLVYKASGSRALKIIPTFQDNLESIMKGIFISKLVESEEEHDFDDLLKSLFKRLVKVTNVFLLRNGNICVESEWMDVDMLTFVKSNGNLFDPYLFLKYMLKTLEILNENKVVHRNIKPSTIFHSEYGFKLAGFELAKKHDQLEREPFKMEGKFNFLAPEIIEQMYKGREKWRMFQSPYSIRSDIFSLGVTLYQLMTLDFNTQWSVYSIQLGDGIEAFLREKITNSKYLNIIPLLARMLHRKKKERISLYVAKRWLNKCISMMMDPIHMNENLEISFSDDDLDNYSESSNDHLEVRLQKWLDSDSDKYNLNDIVFDTELEY